MTITEIDRKTDEGVEGDSKKGKLNILVTLREQRILLHHDVLLHLYTLMKCHQCNRATCVCCEYQIQCT